MLLIPLLSAIEPTSVAQTQSGSGLTTNAPLEKPQLTVPDNGIFTLWQESQLRIHPRYEPKINGDGRRLAIKSDNAVEAWTLESSGKVGKKLWSSEYLSNHFYYTFAWWGSDLLVSRSAQTRATKDHNSNVASGKRKSLDDAAGATLLINPATAKATPLLPAAYLALSVDATGQYLAAISPTHTNLDDAPVEIYQLDKTKKTARLLGKFAVNGWGTKDHGRTSAVVWSPDSLGVYVTRYWEDSTQGFKAGAPLYFIPRAGKGKLVPLKKNLDLLSGPGTVKMLAVAPAENGVWWLANYFYQAWVQVLITPDGVQREVPIEEVQAPLGSLTKNPSRRELSMLGMTPNGRFTLFQDNRATKALDNPQPGDVWAVDSVAKKRRKVITLPPITQSYRWSGNALLVSLRTGARVGFSMTRHGLLRFPEGVMRPDDPKLEAIVAQAPWEDARPPAAPPPPEVAAALEFLKQPALVSVKLPQQWSVPSSQFEEEKQMAPFRLDDAQGGDPRITVEPKSRHVVKFVSPGPQAPQPNTPISTDKAQEMAVTWARAAA